METGHTKGEWRCGAIDGFAIISDLSDGSKQDIGYVKDSFSSSDGAPIKEAIANAKLISASPDMLQALIKIKDYVTRELTVCHKLPQDQIDLILKDVNASINKATK